MKKTKSRFILDYICCRKRAVLLFAVCCAVFGFVFVMYGIPVEAVIYPSVVCCVLIAAYMLYGAMKDYRLLREMQKILQIAYTNPEDSIILLGEKEVKPYIKKYDWYGSLLLEIINRQQLSGKSLIEDMNMKYAEMSDYYTMWAHQIKTPIASLHLILQKEDNENARRMKMELLRIEQYVQMVLCYLRLDSDSTDYQYKEYSLDDIIRPAIKKLAPQFIAKKLSLDYETIPDKILTDEKWLGFVVEQVLTNAVKYTKEGGVKIFYTGSADAQAVDSALIIEDTGIGILPEDLPRIFEKGYTGCNGRMDRRASGIGLYLCRRICGKLGYRINAESEAGKGTRIIIKLGRESFDVD